MSELLRIKYINPKKMILDDGSEYTELTPYYPSWKTGDTIVIEKKEGKFSKMLCRVINKTKNQEIAAFLTSASGDIKKSLALKPSEEEYVNLDTKIRIKKASGELIWLEDDSKWQMWSHLPRDPGPWDEGHVVIVTQRILKSMSKKYQMKNVNTERELTAMFLGYER